MIKIIKGNLLESNDVIVHQVNVHGVMGAGVALQIAIQYPDVFNKYRELCELMKFNEVSLLGRCHICVSGEKTFVNMFSQNVDCQIDGTLTNYECIRTCLRELNSLGDNISIPYKLGCGIAKGNWNTVTDIILEECLDIDVTIYKL